MAKVTMKTGDTGLTRLLGKERVPKSDPRIALLGAVDEATDSHAPTAVMHMCVKSYCACSAISTF